jgi:hypothetical protein
MDERTSIQVRDPVHRSITEFALGSQKFPVASGSRASAECCSAQVRNVLRQLGLTVSDVSALTQDRYGKKTPYFIPSSFQYKLKRGITPRVCQIVALSQITGYRFSDWMRICGFDPRLILDLQLQLENERTIIINAGCVTGTGEGIVPPFNGGGNSIPRYLFAKIGTRDAILYPRLAPGTVVRADTTYGPLPGENELIEKRLWLVEHPAGISCCYLKRINAEQIVLLPSRPPLEPWPLQLSREVRILGLVDREWRTGVPTPVQPMSCRRFSDSISPGVWPYTRAPSFSGLLRLSRSRLGLTLRAAHDMTTRIASLLRYREYTIALGLLSDYEAINRAPRHVAKIISLCVIYGIDLFQLLDAAGIHVDDRGKASLISDNQTEPHASNHHFTLRTKDTCSVA